jgi:sugar phosphate isomerase/epimerase
VGHRIGLAALTVLELTPPDMVSCARDAGFDYVGLRLIPATAEEVQHPILGDTSLVRETERRLQDTGIRVLDVEVFRLKPETNVTVDWEQALATAQRLGATQALIAGNDPDEARMTANFRAFCELAKQYGIAGNIEPMPWTACKTFAQGVRIVEAAGHDNGGVLIDPLHFDRAGCVAGEITAAPRSFLRYMQLCDAPAERPTEIGGLLHQARAGRLMPGDGGLDLKGILRNVPHDLPLSLEIPMEKLTRTMPAVERTKQMLAKARRLIAMLDQRESAAEVRPGA